MQRRLLIVIGIVLALLAGGALLFVLSQQGGGGPVPEGEAVVEEPTAIPMVEVIVARQPIPRGGEFVAEALGRTS
ncbi:MAG: hypothetical protein ACE5G8_18445, partial [Anaerolineae bacterium]